jgi:hypothetical protein
MHEFTRLVKNTPRRQTVDWPEHDIMTLSGDTIDIKAYKAYLHSQLEYLEEFVQEHVLMGLNLEELGIVVNPSHFRDTCDETTPGYGPLTADQHSDYLDNPDSDLFMNALVASGLLITGRDHEGAMLWDQAKTVKWIGDINQAWFRTYPLCHTLQGLPGRGTEECNYQIENTDVSRGHLRVVRGTLGFNSNYHKGVLSTGLYKSVLRLIPYRLARILIILLRIVRPTELSALSESVIPRKKAQYVVQTYQTHIWASLGKQWNSDDMSSALRAFFLQGMDVVIGIRRYRHFATGFQQHYLPYTPQDNSTDLLKVAHLMAGHTEETVDSNYAIRVHRGVTPDRQTELFIQIALDWHRELGFDTFAP